MQITSHEDGSIHVIVCSAAELAELSAAVEEREPAPANTAMRHTLTKALREGDGSR